MLDAPESMDKAEQNNRIDVEDFPLGAWVKAVVLDMFFDFGILASTSLCKSEAAISFFYDVGLLDKSVI